MRAARIRHWTPVLFVRRELRLRGAVLFALALALGAVAAARFANQLGTAAPDTLDPLQIRMLSSMQQYPRIVSALLFLSTPLHLMTRLSEDQESGWTAPFFSAGYSRTGYLLVLLGCTVLGSLFAYTLSAAVFHAIRSGAAPPDLILNVAGTAAGIMSASCFGVIVWLWLRNLNGSVLAALALIAVPIGINFVLMLRTGDVVRSARWLMIHIPRITTAPTLHTLGWTTAYSLLALAVLLIAAQRRVGWQP